jgi:WD40 repeat protein
VHGYYQDSTAPLQTLAFSPVGGQLAAGGNDGVVRLWNALTCKIMGMGIDARCTDAPQRIPVSSMAILTLAWSPNGQLLAVGGMDGSFSIWNLAQSQKPLFSTKLQDSVHSLAWSSDGTHLATASGTTVTVWQWM